MAEWIHEAGIGESRAALIEDGQIIEAAIEREGDATRAGAVIGARLTNVLIKGQRAIITLDNGQEALLEPIPPAVAEGAQLAVEIAREAIAEKGRPKLAKAVATTQPIRSAPSLRQRLTASGLPIRDVKPSDQDWLEQAGWSELVDEALRGEVGFPGGNLRLSMTPAMTLIDVDGALPPAELARAGAAAAARTIRRMGIGGSIGIDFPTLRSKAERLATASAFDALLPQPFERTAINGFGFLQVIRRKERASLPELLSEDRALSAALALLRQGERTPGAGEITLAASPAVIACLTDKPDWTHALAKRAGAAVRLFSDPERTISSAHAYREHP